MKVVPAVIVTVGSTLPTVVRDEDRLMVVSWSALAGFEFASCSCMKMHS